MKTPKPRTMKTVIASGSDYAPTDLDFDFLHSQKITEVVSSGQVWDSWALLNGIPVVSIKELVAGVWGDDIDLAVIFPGKSGVAALAGLLMANNIPYWDLRGAAVCH